MIRLKILMDGKHFLPMIEKIYCASNLSLKKKQKNIKTDGLLYC